ncbi:MAG: hypothetical protein AB7H90_16785 [Alphaproteobacteria bacterium]
MAVIIGGGLELRSSVTDTAATALNGVFGLEIVAIDGKRFVYAAGKEDDGLTVFELGADGSLTSIQTIGDTGTTALNGAYNLISATISGQTYLYVNSIIDNGISVFRVEADGKLTFVDSVFDDIALELERSEGKMSVATIGGKSYLLATGYYDLGFSIFSIGADGRLTSVQNVDDQTNTDFTLSGAGDVAVGSTGGHTFAFVAGYSDHGISSFEIAPNGALTFRSSVTDNATLELTWVRALATARIGSTLFLFAGGDENGISVFSIDSQGQFDNVFNLADGATLGLFHIQSLSTFEIGGRTFLAVSSQESALSYFDVAADGSLTPVATLFDTVDLGLWGGGNQQFVSVGGSAYLVAAGQNDWAVSVFEIGAGDETLIGTAAADTIHGLGGNNILSGHDGNDTLNGDAGDDVLLGGLGADALNGGGGFDFASYSNAAAGLTASLANPASNTGEAVGDTYTSIEGLIGSAFNDVLIGAAGVNEIRGGGGDDFISDDSGASSVLNGETGNDAIYGGPGNDYMIGGNGNDTLIGGVDGQDSLYGGAGNDYLVAADQNNNGIGSVLDGGAGANQLYALVGIGNDYAVGGQGADTIATGAGSDYIFGNAGNDTIVAGTGTDYIYSGAGNDFIYTDDLVTNSQDFVYVSGLSGFGTGVDTVADFTPGAGGDVAVILSTPELTSFAEVQAKMTDIDVYTVIDLSATDRLYLYNIDPFQLTPDNFLFL